MNNLIVKVTKNGKGVFANREFRERELIIKFKGKIFTLEELPNPYCLVDDHYVQIEENLYLGPSGGLDDFINHSCDPNSGLVIDNKDFMLIAIKNIKSSEEITWDYSTTMDEDDWGMDCNCDMRRCRGRIRDFKYLPRDLQRRYIKYGIVPKYILNRVNMKLKQRK